VAWDAPRATTASPASASTRRDGTRPRACSTPPPAHARRAPSSDRGPCKRRVVVVSYNDESWVPADEAARTCARCTATSRCSAFDFPPATWVAQIGIHNPQGRAGGYGVARPQTASTSSWAGAAPPRCVVWSTPRRRWPSVPDPTGSADQRQGRRLRPSARPPASRRGSTRTTSAGSPSARSVTCRWSCGASTATEPPRRPPRAHAHRAGQSGRGDAHRRALRRRQHAQTSPTTTTPTRRPDEGGSSGTASVVSSSSDDDYFADPPVLVYHRPLHAHVLVDAAVELERGRVTWAR